jgi:hypothetical protein
MEGKVANVEREVAYFDKMIAGAERLVRPWKTTALALVAAIVFIVGAGLLYLYQYEATSTEAYEYEVDGVSPSWTAAATSSPKTCRRRSGRDSWSGGL